MGIIRKATSISTGGVVHYRTANQKTARYAKKSYKLQKRQAGLSPTATETVASMGPVGRAIFLGVMLVVVVGIVVLIATS